MINKKISIFLVTILAAFTLCLSLPNTKVNAASENMTDLLREHFNNTYFSERQENTLFYLGNNFNVDYFGFNSDYSDRSFGITNYTLREYNKGVRVSFREMAETGTHYAYGQPSQNGLDFVVYNNSVCKYVQYEFNDLLLPSTVSNPNLPNLFFNFLNSFSFTFDINNANLITYQLYIDMYRNNSETDGSYDPDYLPSYDIMRVYSYFVTPVVSEPFSLSIIEDMFDNFNIYQIYSISTSRYTSSSLSTYIPYLIYVPRIIIRVSANDNASLGQYYIKEKAPFTNPTINNYNYALSAVREKNFYNTMLEVVNSDIADSESEFGFHWGYDWGYEDGYIDGQNAHASPFVIITETVEHFLNLEIFPSFHVYYLLLIALGFGLFGLIVKYALGG